MPKDPEEEGFTVVDKRGRRDTADSAAGPSASAQGSPVATPVELDLTALFLMLASSALIHLGNAPDPTTGARRRDLAQARLSIDLLRLLREKTEGHRTTEESQLLEDLLYDLQLQFVAAVEETSCPES